MRILIALTTVALLGTAPVQAQDEDTRSGSAVVADFAQCVVRGDRGSASALLETMPGSNAEKAIDFRIKKRFDRCLALPDTARLSPVLTRGAIATILYRETSGGRAPAGITSQGYGAAWISGPEAPTGAALAPYAFATCIASANPQAAHDLTISTAGSGEERTAVQALSGSFPACFPKGGQLTLNRITIRALTAEALYHLVRAR